MTSVPQNSARSGSNTARPAAPETVAARDTVRWLLLGAGLLYALLYVAFFPRTYAIMDESAYLSLAYALRHGTVWADAVGVKSVFEFTSGPHRIVMYPPGLPALYALVSTVGWKAVLGVNLVMHLATFAVTAAILRRLKLPPTFALLYLLHPTAVIYSRTVMSDVPTALLFACAFWAYLSRRYVLVGVLAGCALWVRNASLIGGPLLMLACLLEPIPGRAGAETEGRLVPALRFPDDWRERLWAGVRVFLGWLPLFIGAYAYQKIVQENGWGRFPLLKLSAFPHGLLFYGSRLLLIYPGMLLAPALFCRSGRAALCCVCYGFILLYSCYDFTDVAGGKVESFVVGQRYLLTVMPLLVVAYAALVQTVAARLRVPAALQAVVAAGTVGVLFLGAGAIHYKHQKALTEIVQVRDAVAAVISPEDDLTCNAAIAKLFHPGWNHPQIYRSLAFEPEQLRPIITTMLADKSRRDVIAIWTRDYRTEAGGEAGALHYVEAAFATRSLLSEQQRAALPRGVFVLEILGPRGENKTTTLPPGRPSAPNNAPLPVYTGKVGDSL